MEDDRRITALKVENNLLSDKLKNISFQIDNFVKQHIQNQQKTQRKNVNLQEQQELYMMSMENQIKVNERMVDQILAEKAKMQMRQEQLENAGYMQQLKDEIERTQQEIGTVKNMNYRLSVEQYQNIEQLNKFSDTYKNDENHALKKIKQINDEIQRANLQIVEKERVLDAFMEKEIVIIQKADAARKKIEQYKGELEEIKGNVADNDIISEYIQVSNHSSITPKNPRATPVGGGSRSGLARGKSQDFQNGQQALKDQFAAITKQLATLKSQANVVIIQLQQQQRFNKKTIREMNELVSGKRIYLEQRMADLAMYNVRNFSRELQQSS